MALVNPTSGGPGQLALIRFRDQLRSPRNARRAVAEARANLSPRLYSAIIASTLARQPTVLGDPFPKAFPRGVVPVTFSPVSVHREILWAAAYIRTYRDRLTPFLQDRRLLSTALLHSDYGSCASLLDGIHEKFGASLWLVKNRLALLQAAEGLESQKAFASTLLRDLSDVGLVEYITYYLSVRNEPSVTPARFWETVARTHRDHAMDADIDVYLRFHIEPLFNLSSQEIADILRIEQWSSLVDYYETLVRIMQIGLAGEHPDLLGTIGRSVASLELDAADERLPAILWAAGQPHQVSHELETDQIVDLFLGGDFARAAQRGLEALSGAITYGLLDVVARSAAVAETQIAGDGKLANSVVARMVNVISNVPSADQDASFLLRIAINHDSHPWALGLLGFLTREGSPHPMESGNGTVPFAALAAPPLGPLQLDSFQPLSLRQTWATSRSAHSENPLCVAWAEAIAGDTQRLATQPIVPEQRALVEAELALHRSDHEATFRHATSLLGSGHRYYRHLGIRFATRALLEMRCVTQCLQMTVDHYLSYPEHYRILPIEEIAILLASGQEQELQGSLELPVFYDIAGKHTGAEHFESKTRYAYEDFLSAQSVDTPCQLKTRIPELPHPLLVYFLRYICVESIMDNSLMFASSQEVTDERLRVLQCLVILDPDNVESYQSETKTLHRTLTIQKGLREVEQSRVYVDHESIRKIADKSIRESFNRYVSFLRHGFEVGDFKEVWVALEQAAAGKPERFARLSLPRNEVTRLFEGIVSDIRDEYVTGARHGLDGYLSTRIRHGTLSAQLRRPLEVAHLVTERDHRTDSYKRNEYWIQRLGVSDHTVAEALDERLRNFSSDVDHLLGQIVYEWIQVKRAGKESGLFDFAIAPAHLSLLAAYITEQTSFENFIDDTIILLDGILERNLGEVRSRLDSEIKEVISKLLEDLQKNCERLLFTVDSRPLSNSIASARTETLVTIDRIIDWFRRPRASASDPFEIDLPIDIATRSVQTFRPEFKLKLDSMTDDGAAPISGPQLPSMVDIFFILFENVVRHSGCSDPSATVAVHHSVNKICVEVQNTIHGDAVSDETLRRIDSIKRAVDCDEYHASIATEGGTGFHKIAKILSHDFGVTSGLGFGFSNENAFTVSIELPYRVHER